MFTKKASEGPLESSVSATSNVLYGLRSDDSIVEGNRHLSLIIQEYKPNVACSESAATASDISACQQVLNHMPADTRPQRFGLHGTSNIDVELPKTFTDGRVSDVSSRLDILIEMPAGQDICAITVAITGNPIYAQWRDIWASAISVTGVCVLQGKDGSGTLNSISLGNLNAMTVLIVIQSVDRPYRLAS